MFLKILHKQTQDTQHHGQSKQQCLTPKKVVNKNLYENIFFKKNMTLEFFFLGGAWSSIMI